MESENNSRNVLTLEPPTANPQIHMIVRGCNVKLNFPLKSEGTEVNDVKRIILGGSIKT